MMDKSQVRRKNLQLLVSYERTIAEFARKYDIDKTYIQQILGGQTIDENGVRRGRNIGEKSARTIERKCGLEHEWLDTPHFMDSNVTPGQQAAGRIPFITWVQAGAIGGDMKASEIPDVKTWISSPVPHGEGTFALRVVGAAMFNAADGQNSFPEGQTIFVDPTREAQHGSNVVINLPGTGEAIFRQLVVEAGRKFMKALNPAWPDSICPLPDDATIIGAVVFSGRQW